MSEQQQQQTNGGLAEFAREIERITRASAIVEPQIIELPGERLGVYAIVTPQPAGAAPNVDIRVAHPGWCNEMLSDVDQMIAFIQAVNEKFYPDVKNGAVFIEKTCIKYVYDILDGRDEATCQWLPSEQWLWLAQCPKQLTQRDAIRALRIVFDGCLHPDSNLINVLRKVRWTQDGNVESAVQKGREGIGQQISREIAGMNDFPDEFAVTFRPFANCKQTVQVRVAFEILPDVQKFEFIAFPNQLVDAMEKVLESTRAKIQDATGVPAFIGRPRL